MIRKGKMLGGASLMTLALMLPSTAAGDPRRDIPSAVSVIDAEELERSGVNTSAADLLKNWCPKPARPITVGSNGAVGSGAQLKKKLAGAAMGAASNVLGGFLGGGGGGGGRSSGPATVRCKIKRKDMTVYNDPLTGIELQVGARRSGDNVEVFSRVKDSPDKGTFQTAYVEREGGDFRTPTELGMCDLYGEFKLTVSWTKDTYVNGQHVDHQEGGWSELGNFKIPGMLSSDEAPDGFWRMLGFSNASAGAQQIRTTFALPEGSLNGTPTAFTVHITTPGQDPVVTVPFTIMMEETDDGFLFSEVPQQCSDPALFASNDFGGAGFDVGFNAGGGGIGPVRGLDGGGQTIIDGVVAAPQTGRAPPDGDQFALDLAKAAAEAGFLSPEASAHFGLKNKREPAPDNVSNGGANSASGGSEASDQPVRSILNDVARPRDEQTTPNPPDDEKIAGGLSHLPPPDDAFAAELAKAAAEGGLISPEAADRFGLNNVTASDALTTSQDRQSSFEVHINDQVTRALKNDIARTFSNLQTDVATEVNAFFEAAERFQSKYSFIASTSTEMQGLLQDWIESREIYENADFQFGVANLGVAGASLGFKGVKWFIKKRGDRAAARAAAAFDGAVTQADDALSGAFATYDAKLGQQKVGWAQSIADLEKELAEAAASGEPASVIDLIRRDITILKAEGAPTEVPATLLTGAERLVQYLDPDVIKLAREEGANMEAYVARLGKKFDEVADNDELVALADDVDWAILRSIFVKRGWHDVPEYAQATISTAMLEARKALAGTGDAISPEAVQTLSELKDGLRAMNMDFSEWLRTAAGELAFGADRGLKAADGRIIYEDVIEGIALYYDEADIKLINAIIDSGGDISKLRTMISEVQQASLNGVARGLGQRAYEVTDYGFDIHRALFSPANMIDTVKDEFIEPAYNPFAEEVAYGPAPEIGTPGEAQGPTRGQDAANVLYGTGQLGQVGLGGFIDAFGVTGDSGLTAESGTLGLAGAFFTSIPGELWQILSEPITTTASHYYSYEALGAYNAFLDGYQTELIEMVVAYSEALSALERVGDQIGKDRVVDAESFLGGEAIEALKAQRDAYQATLDEASPEWRETRGAAVEDRIENINQTIADLEESIADLVELAVRVQQMHAWLEALRFDAEGAPRPTTELFNPVAFVRMASTLFFVNALSADAFGLTEEPALQFRRRPGRYTQDEIREKSEKLDALQDERAAYWENLPEQYELDASLDDWLDQYDQELRAMESGAAGGASVQ
ncbi:MAG: hypothetical protein AAFW81_00370 [Pseudomonadota bacterium]